MNIIEQFLCKHAWTFHGWSYVKCIKCGKVKDDENLNAKLQKEFWESRIDETHPAFTRDAINNLLNKRGRSI